MSTNNFHETEYSRLDKQLYDACCKEEADYKLVEDLLEKGADPLRIFNEYDDAVLEELFCHASDNMEDSLQSLDSRVPKLVELFIKHGMDINTVPDIPEDDCISPLWTLSFWCTPNAIRTLKILLDSGLKAPELEMFISHFVEDAAYVSGNIDSKEYYDYLICGIKMIMLSASYEDIFSTSKYLRKVIDAETNEENDISILHRFRDYDDYNYDIDKSTCTNLRLGIVDATVTIKEKNSGKTVWKFLL